MHNYSSKNKSCLEDSARKLLQLNEFKPKVRVVINHLLELISKWRSDLKTKKHYDLWKQIGYDSQSTFGCRQDLIKTKTDFGTKLADILGLEHPQIVMTEQCVGQNIPMHMDVNASASDAGFGINDTIDRGIRIILFVTDWEPGQVFMMGNRTLSQWRAGETLYWPVTKYPHGTYNGSHKTCYRIRISGLSTKKFHDTIKNDITI